jgi:hypothetical protein
MFSDTSTRDYEGFHQVNKRNAMLRTNHKDLEKQELKLVVSSYDTTERNTGRGRLFFFFFFFLFFSSDSGQFQTAAALELRSNAGGWTPFVLPRGPQVFFLMASNYRGQ